MHSFLLIAIALNGFFAALAHIWALHHLLPQTVSETWRGGGVCVCVLLLLLCQRCCAMLMCTILFNSFNLFFLDSHSSSDAWRLMRSIATVTLRASGSFCRLVAESKWLCCCLSVYRFFLLTICIQLPPGCATPSPRRHSGLFIACCPQCVSDTGGFAFFSLTMSRLLC
jgi:hypothetical protein